MTSAKCVGKGNQIFPKGEDPDLLLVEGGFGCKAIREKECTLSDQDYKIGWNCLDKVERQQWIVDIEEKWYRLEKLPASEVQVKKKKLENVGKSQRQRILLKKIMRQGMVKWQVLRYMVWMVRLGMLNDSMKGKV